MQLRAYLPYIFFFLLLVGIAFALTYTSLDPDFGWHVKSGELILERGVPYQDWYSFTMPGFAWINHEWLMDVGMYKVYGWLGLYGLLLVFLAFYTASFFIIKKPGQPFWLFAIPVFLGFMPTVEFLGIRPQLFTVFFVAILLWLLDAFLEKSSKTIWLLPALFLAWVNLHASFSAGLFILCIVLICEITKRRPRQQIAILAGVTALSFLVTLANPYGIRIYEELLRTLGDSYLKFNIAEWLPLFLSGFKPLISLYIGFTVACVALLYKKLKLRYVALSVIFFLLALSSIRYFLIFVIVSMPMLIESAVYVKAAAGPEKIKLIMRHEPLFYKLICFGPALVCLVSFGIYFYQVFSSNMAAPVAGYYPEKALAYVRTLPLSENMFNEYGWGGYMIWRLPERKVFIDGRMPSWRQDGQFVFQEYVTVTSAEKGFESILEKYDVTYVFIPVSVKHQALADRSNAKKARLQQIAKEHPWIGFIVGVSKHRNNLYEELTRLGWSTAYEDETAMMLKKP